VAIITIARQRATGGHQIARRLAEQLGYAFVDRRSVERALNIAVFTPGWDELAAVPHGTDPLVAAATLEVLGDLRRVPGSSTRPDSFGAYEHRPTQRQSAQFYAGLLRVFVETVAESDHAVILGRGANFLLAGESDTIRVRIVGSRERRIVRLATGGNLSVARATEIVISSDRIREDFVRTALGRNWGDPTAYDLTIDTDATPLPVAVGAIAARALSLPGRTPATPTPA